MPLLLVGHGTVDGRGVAEFIAFTERMRRAMAGIDVAGSATHAMLLDRRCNLFTSRSFMTP